MQIELIQHYFRGQGAFSLNNHIILSVNKLLAKAVRGWLTIEWLLGTFSAGSELVALMLLFQIKAAKGVSSSCSIWFADVYNQATFGKPMFL